MMTMIKGGYLFRSSFEIFRVSSPECFHSMLLAEQHYCEGLFDFAMSYALRHFSECLKSDENNLVLRSQVHRHPNRHVARSLFFFSLSIYVCMHVCASINLPSPCALSSPLLSPSSIHALARLLLFAFLIVYSRRLSRTSSRTTSSQSRRKST